jgi:MFS family permease
MATPSPSPQITAFPKAFWWLCGLSTLFFSGYHILTTLLPLYWLHLNIPPAQIGLFLACFMGASLLIRPIVGKLYTISSPKRLLALGVLLFLTATSLLFALPQQTATFIIVRSLQGLGFAIFYTASRSLCTELIPQERRAYGISWLSNAEKLATAFAPWLGWTLASAFWYQQGLGLSITLMLLVGLGLTMVQLPTSLQRQQATLPAIVEHFNSKTGWFSKKAVFPGVMIAANSLVYGALMPFVPLIAHAKHLTHVEWFHACFALSLIASRLATGTVSDTHGRHTVIIPGMLGVALGLVVLLLSQTAPMFLLGTLLYGFGAGVIQPSLIALVADRTPFTERGSGMATFTLLTDLGQGLGQLTMGFALQYLSYQWGLVVVIAFNLLGLAWFISRYKKEETLALY